MKKIKILFFSILGFCLFITYANAANNPTPLIVLIEQNPWLMVIGSDSPSFALYDDGKLIYLKSFESGKKEYLYASLDNDSLQKIIKKLKPSSEYLKLEDEYNLSDWTDQPTQKIIISLINLRKNISVYGDLREDKEVRKKAPKPIIELFDQIIAYDTETAQKWLPAKIEVMIWPYKYAPDKSIIWPTDWPDINHKSTKKRGDSYSIYLDSSKYQELVNFLKASNKKGAVEINKKKWAVSLRFPFPNEEKWMNKPP